MKLKRLIQYLIIPVSVTPRQLKNFEYKIPEDFAFVTGVLVTITPQRPLPNNTHMGQLSLSFNSKASNPINMPVQIENVASKKRGYNFLKLAEPLEGGTYIEGVYKEQYAGHHTNSTIRIYLQGIKFIEEKTNQSQN